MGVATAGYCVGNLNMEGNPLGGEDPSWTYPGSLASPLQARPHDIRPSALTGIRTARLQS